MTAPIPWPDARPLVAASILSADFANIRSECLTVLEPATGDAALALHLDVMDGHFVPNLTMGPDMCRALRRAFPDVFLDVHLMVQEPGLFVEPFAEAGANHLTFHIEPFTGPDEVDRVRRLSEQIRALGCTAGLAINPDADPARVLPCIEELDLLLVMSVFPGFSGQSFLEHTLESTRRLRAEAGSAVRIQMDGGVGPATAARVREAGCDVLVAASALFKAPAADRGEVVRVLQAG